MLHRVKTSDNVWYLYQDDPNNHVKLFIFNIITHYIPGNTRIPLTCKIRQNCQGFQ